MSKYYKQSKQQTINQHLKKIMRLNKNRRKQRGDNERKITLVPQSCMLSDA